MDITKFQEKLSQIYEEGRKNGNVLKPEQVRACFAGMELDTAQLLKILQYLKAKGIAVEGTPQETPAEEPKETEEPSRSVPLTVEEKLYLRDYLASLEQNTEKEDKEELFVLWAKGDPAAREKLSREYLAEAARLAAEMNCAEIPLQDLIQEANISLLTALTETPLGQGNGQWLLGEIRRGIQRAIEEQTQRKQQDDSLVARVEKLESAVRELTEEDEEESARFSIGELAILLDMDEEEIRDTLRLTGDDK